MMSLVVWVMMMMGLRWLLLFAPVNDLLVPLVVDGGASVMMMSHEATKRKGRGREGGRERKKKMITHVKYLHKTRWHDTHTRYYMFNKYKVTKQNTRTHTHMYMYIICPLAKHDYHRDHHGDQT